MPWRTMCFSLYMVTLRHGICALMCLYGWNGLLIGTCHMHVVLCTYPHSPLAHATPTLKFFAPGSTSIRSNIRFSIAKEKTDDAPKPGIPRGRLQAASTAPRTSHRHLELKARRPSSSCFGCSIAPLPRPASQLSTARVAICVLYFCGSLRLGTSFCRSSGGGSEGFGGGGASSSDSSL